MYKKSKKIIATMLLMIITLANFSNVGIYASEVLAENVSLEKQNAKTNNSNVEFNAYFVSEENKIYSCNCYISRLPGGIHYSDCKQV